MLYNFITKKSSKKTKITWFLLVHFIDAYHAYHNNCQNIENKYIHILIQNINLSTLYCKYYQFQYVLFFVITSKSIENRFIILWSVLVHFFIRYLTLYIANFTFFIYRRTFMFVVYFLWICAIFFFIILSQLWLLRT